MSAERPGDRFLSNYTSADLQLRTGFSRRHVATFHKHYLDAKEAVAGVTAEEKSEFLAEFGLEGDPTTLGMLAALDDGCPMHFDEYLVGLSFMRNKQGAKPARFRFVFQMFASSDRGLALEDLVDLLNKSLPEEVLAQERAETRIFTWCKRHFPRFDDDQDGFIGFKEFQAFLRLDNGLFTAEDIEINVPNVVGLIKGRRRQQVLLEKLMSALRN
jgi:hypothetical protein